MSASFVHKITYYIEKVKWVKALMFRHKMKTLNPSQGWKEKDNTTPFIIKSWVFRLSVMRLTILSFSCVLMSSLIALDCRWEVEQFSAKETGNGPLTLALCFLCFLADLNAPSLPKTFFYVSFGSCFTFYGFVVF